MHFFWNIFVTLFCIFAIWKGCGVIGLSLSCRFETAVSFVNQKLEMCPSCDVVVPSSPGAGIHWSSSYHSFSSQFTKKSEIQWMQLLILSGNESHFTKSIVFPLKRWCMLKTSLRSEDLTTKGSSGWLSWTLGFHFFLWSPIGWCSFLTVGRWPF